MLSLLAALVLAATPASTADPVTLDVCRYAMLQTKTEIAQSPGVVIEHYISASKMNPEQASTQRAVCGIYFQGAQDLLALQAPTV